MIPGLFIFQTLAQNAMSIGLDVSSITTPLATATVPLLDAPQVDVSPQGYVGLINYWVVILLMMTGFYIVIGQRNLIKSIIGLNIFQTSVFLLYITMGKVRGGTAPIIQGDPHGHDHHAEDHHGGDHHAAADHGGHGHAADALTDSAGHGPGVDPGITPDHEIASGHDIASGHGDHVESVAEVLYSNPLPSVLMLTAIVVGIATTALALSLIVRIREGYGTIEEDEILEINRREDIATVPSASTGDAIVSTTGPV